MKGNILMIYPEIPTTFWSLKYSLEFIGYKSLMPPLGLMTVAAMLPKDYDIKLVDMNVTKLAKEDVQNADLVFISAMIIQKESFDTAVELCNACGKTVVAGGPYPTTSHQNIKGVDCFVLNEAEVTLPRFLLDYEAGSVKKIYTSAEKPDITKTPPPRLDIIDKSMYSTLALQYSRGCPFNCEFCDIIEMFGRKPRTKTPGQFVRELQNAYDMNFGRPIFIVDDNFIGNKHNVKMLLRSIIEWQKKTIIRSHFSLRRALTSPVTTSS